MKYSSCELWPCFLVVVAVIAVVVAGVLLLSFVISKNLFVFFLPGTKWIMVVSLMRVELICNSKTKTRIIHINNICIHVYIYNMAKQPHLNWPNPPYVVR